MWRHGISFAEEVQLGNRTNTILTTVWLFPFLVALLFLSVMIMSDSNKTTHCILLSLKYSCMVQEIYTCILADAFIQSDLRFRKYIFLSVCAHSIILLIAQGLILPIADPRGKKQYEEKPGRKCTQVSKVLGTTMDRKGTAWLDQAQWCPGQCHKFSKNLSKLWISHIRQNGTVHVH